MYNSSNFKNGSESPCIRDAKTINRCPLPHHLRCRFGNREFETLRSVNASKFIYYDEDNQ